MEILNFDFDLINPFKFKKYKDCQIILIYIYKYVADVTIQSKSLKLFGT